MTEPALFLPEEIIEKDAILCSPTLDQTFSGMKSCYLKAHSLCPQGEPWPSQTRACCNHDGHPFDTIPVPLPQHYSIERNQYRVYPQLVFCSFNCAKKYAQDHRNYTSHEVTLLNQMARQVFGIHGPIVPAPPAYALQGFVSGYLSLAEFRSKSLSGMVLSHTDPFITVTMLFEEKHRVTEPVTTEDSKTTVDTINKAMQSVKLKGASTTADENGIYPSTSAYMKFVQDKQNKPKAITDLEEEDLEPDEHKEKQKRSKKPTVEVLEEPVIHSVETALADHTKKRKRKETPPAVPGSLSQFMKKRV